MEQHNAFEILWSRKKLPQPLWLSLFSCHGALSVVPLAVATIALQATVRSDGSRYVYATFVSVWVRLLCNGDKVVECGSHPTSYPTSVL